MKALEIELKLVMLGYYPVGLCGDDFRAHIKKQSEEYGRVIRDFSAPTRPRSTSSRNSTGSSPRPKRACANSSRKSPPRKPRGKSRSQARAPVRWTVTNGLQARFELDGNLASSAGQSGNGQR